MSQVTSRVVEKVAMALDTGRKPSAKDLADLEIYVAQTRGAPGLRTYRKLLQTRVYAEYDDGRPDPFKTDEHFEKKRRRSGI